MGSAFPKEHWLDAVPKDDPLWRELVLFAYGDRRGYLLHRPNPVCPQEAPHLSSACPYWKQAETVASEGA